MNLPALLKKLSLDRRTGTITTCTVADWTTSGIIFSAIQRNADRNLLLQSHRGLVGPLRCRCHDN
jgi:hypothetical protein